MLQGGPIDPEPGPEPATAEAPAPTADGPAKATEPTPAEGRTRTLTSVAAAARASGAEWFGLRGLPDRPPTVVLPALYRQAFLRELLREDESVHVRADPSGEAQRHADAEITAPAGILRTIAPLLVEAQPLSLRLGPTPMVNGRARLARHGTGIDVDFWGDDDGVMVPGRGPEWVTEFRPGATPVTDLEVDGVCLPTPSIAARPTFGEVTFPVDAVYTWVDGGDPEWLARRARRLGGLGELTGLSATSAASGRARFNSRDELRYSLRSLRLFAPWFRHVYLITDGQLPPWLDPEHPDLTVVTHDDILPAADLPTFNSHAIESALHHVPGLGEHFVYFNDDVLLGRPLSPERFFSPAGSFAAFLGDQVLGEERDDPLPYQRAGLNNRALLLREFDRTSTRVMRHAPHPLTRTLMSEVERRFGPEVAATRTQPWRSPVDVSVASSLAQHTGLATGAAHAAEIDVSYVNITGATVDSVLDELLRTRSSEVICMADHHDWALPEARVNLLLRDFFEAYYPVPAPWERDL